MRRLLRFAQGRIVEDRDVATAATAPNADMSAIRHVERLGHGREGLLGKAPALTLIPTRKHELEGIYRDITL